MLWYIAYPVDTTWLHFDIGIETFSYSIVDDDLLALIQQVYHLLLLGYSCVYL